MTGNITFTIPRHGVMMGSDGFSPLQRFMIDEPAPVRIASAPTGAGKSYGFIRLLATDADTRILFVVPTRRLAQNLAISAIGDLAAVMGIDPEQAAKAVQVWSSDATREFKERDPTMNVGLHRVRVVRDPDAMARMIIATPESLAHALVKQIGEGHGTTGFMLGDLIHFRHVVFDEFHTIEARGFGLCAAVAAVASKVIGGPKITFLSATPIEIEEVLKSAGVDAAHIARRSEEVRTTTDTVVDGMAFRAIHGDVMITLHPGKDTLDILRETTMEMRDCIARKKQIVVILDSVDTLLSRKEAYAEVFDSIGVDVNRRMAINSIDDNTTRIPGDLFHVEARADPKAFEVLLATSSIEMGVTFAAGMIVMDPGHDQIGMMQRIGRVARGDEPGSVHIAVSSKSRSRKSWLREIPLEIEKAMSSETVDIVTLTRIAMDSTMRRFDDDEAKIDDPGAAVAAQSATGYGTMSKTAAWCAALFWYAMEDRNSRASKYTGSRETLKALESPKTRAIASMIGAIRRPVAGSERVGWRWADGFMKEGVILRSFKDTILVREPSGRERGNVQLRMIESRPRLRSAYVSYETDGTPVLNIDDTLEMILGMDPKIYVEETRAIILPDGSTTEVPADSFRSETARILKKMAAKETDPKLKKRFEAAHALFVMTGLMPRPNDTPMPGGSSSVA